jgi:CRP/FNR family cyclic AMP-dependent transcriptional regulator
MPHDVKGGTLESIRLLRGVSSKEKEGLARASAFKRFDAHEQILDRDNESQDVFFVCSGRVRIVNYSLSGREVSLADIPAGGHFGELAALDGEPRSASAMALEESIVAIMPPDTFLGLIKIHPDVMLGVMQSLTRIIRRSTERIMDLSTLGANNRVHAELLRLARSAMVGDNTAVIKPIPVHGELAASVSTTRETVARVLSELAKKGFVKRGKDALHVSDVEALEEMVENVRGE